jgi:hypothetical protein
MRKEKKKKKITLNANDEELIAENVKSKHNIY